MSEYYNNENNSGSFDGNSQSSGSSYGPFVGTGPTDENPTYRYSRSHIPQEPVKKPKTKLGFFGVLKKGIAIAFCGVILGVFAGTGFYAVNLFTDKFSEEVSKNDEAENDVHFKEPIEEKPEVLPDPIIEEILEASPEEIPEVVTPVLDASEVVEKCMPSIVAINTKYTQTYQSIFGQTQQYEGQSSGSGVIVGENDDELLIVTNSHVVENMDELTVQFIDTSTADAQIKGSQTGLDIAIIAVKKNTLTDDTMRAISIATMGDSDSLKLGEPAIVIGNALGYGQSVTSGIISAVDRDFDYDNVSHKVIQTDAAINPGNSGGALLNMKGELIGINEAKYSQTAVEGVGYAIPISEAKPTIEELSTRTTRSKLGEGESGYLGIAGVDVSQDAANMYGIPVGVYISYAEEGQAADKAGLTKGDIITEFDGESVTSMERLKEVLAYYPAGTQVVLKIQRMGNEGYEEKAVNITLGKRAE